MTQALVTGQWFYRVGEVEHGPVSLVEVQKLIFAGQLGPAVMVRAEGTTEWQPLAKVPALGTAEDPAVKWLIPTGPQSGAAFVAGYCGLLGMIAPLAPFGLILGVIGIVDLKRNPRKRGWGRAITGVVVGGFFTVLYGYLFLH